ADLLLEFVDPLLQVPEANLIGGAVQLLPPTRRGRLLSPCLGRGRCFCCFLLPLLGGRGGLAPIGGGAVGRGRRGHLRRPPYVVRPPASAVAPFPGSTDADCPTTATGRPQRANAIPTVRAHLLIRGMILSIFARCSPPRRARMPGP